VLDTAGSAAADLGDRSRRRDHGQRRSPPALEQEAGGDLEAPSEAAGGGDDL